ncbi:ribokinase [Aphanomyces astaci]|uniref:Ribokinase n=2 Tax=Aphanomyces astaci TaxID=112090 RepID=W4G7X6_APHAT|nr:ribokinase [Aphanomyces astaci]ETV75139.1 ribokinase [Aphanomyces astaci]RLO08308.1 hypothetical protein DYB28_010631 [Aphanomyces astaci]|eukprot:XP_009835187.1 ribokinase [Aphanomyces astaci]
MTTPKVLVVGSINADIFLDVPRIPLLGETLAATGSRCLVGGKGANQAVAARRSNVDTSFMCQFGYDHAKLMQEYLAGADVTIDASSTVHTQTVSGQAIIFLVPSGDNSIVILPGANAVWPAALSPQMQQSVSDASVVLLQCEIPASVNRLIAEHAKAVGTTVLWDLGGEERDVDDEFLRLVDYVCPNETELRRCVHSPHALDTLDAVLDAARTLQRRGDMAVLVTRGSDGSVLIAKDGSVHVQPSFDVPVRDTTGAGDCFRGAFAAQLAQNATVAQSLRYAAASSALCVQRDGATMPTHAETLAFLKLSSI